MLYGKEDNASGSPGGDPHEGVPSANGHHAVSACEGHQCCPQKDQRDCSWKPRDQHRYRASSCQVLRNIGEILDQSAHCPNYEQGEEFNQIAISFLASGERRTGNHKSNLKNPKKLA